MPTTITVYIADRGTPLADGGMSSTGHMWIGLSKDGVNTYYGFAPIDHNAPIGPGDIFLDDNVAYQAYQYSRSIEVTDAQFERIFDFVDKETTPFDLNYNGATNSCVDFVWGAINAGGLNPDNIDPDVWPGNNQNDIDGIQNPELGIGKVPYNLIILPSWLLPVVGMQDSRGTVITGGGGGWYCPLILDLDGDGAHSVNLGWVENRSRVYFDMDNDGYAERTAWVAAGDGLLAIDKNGNGKIDGQGELFGNGVGFADGFASLKQYDSNADNKITAADAANDNCGWRKSRVA
jgi:hypothetical protein